MTALRTLLFLEAASLVGAAILHTGALTGGPPDDAAMYETGIAVILAVGLGITFIQTGWARLTGLVVQAIALVGASIGTYATLRGFGPSSPLDVVYHVVLIGLIVAGLAVAWRLPASGREAPTG